MEENQHRINSQISVQSGKVSDIPPSRPFYIYSDTGITGTAAGNVNVESYCSLESTSNSR